MPHPGGPGPTVAEGGRAKHCRHGDLGDPGDPQVRIQNCQWVEKTAPIALIF